MHRSVFLEHSEYLNILALRNHHFGILETSVPDTETTIDWLDYPVSEM